MRVVLVGPPSRIERLRAQLPDSVHVIGQASTLAAARAIGDAADAFVIAPTPAPEEQSLVEALTHRETEVLGLLADGLPNKAIAARLNISEETVKFHLAAVFGKLDASNRTDAVRKALRRGLVPL